MEGNENTADQSAALSYEEGYERLQRILERLEAADLPLEDSLELYESGMKLAASCSKLLEEAELRVRQWQPDGSLQEFVAQQDQ